MDELQLTFISGKFFIWGLSSNSDEVFTSVERLRAICNRFFQLNKATPSKEQIEIPALGDVPCVSSSLQMAYNQFEEKKPAIKKFLVNGLKTDGQTISHGLLSIQPQQGAVIGDSIEFFRICLRFAYGLVSRQRFTPSYQDNESCFIPNIDAHRDFTIFSELAQKAPLSIKPKVSEDVEYTLKNALTCFVNLLVVNSIDGLHLGIKKETKTDEWIYGLLGQKSKIDDNVKKGIDEWLSAKKIHHETEFNMLFKLEEPDEERNEWTLTFNMQNRKDPSHIISLEELWKNPAKVPIPSLKMHLLKNLGVAARFSKQIEKSLYSKNPSKISIPSDTAFEFISKESYFLKEAGFSVQIPKITVAKVNSLRVKIRIKNSGKFRINKGSSLGSTLFEFDYTASLGDVELTPEELFELSKRKERLVRVKGKWVELNSEDIKKVISFFEKKKQISIHDTFVINSSQENKFEIDEIITPKEFESSISGLFNFSAIAEVKAPAEFAGTLRAYQKHGLSWLLFLRNLGFGGILADDMGLGKTIQVIAYLLSANPKAPSLIICPASVIRNWDKELSRFSPSLKVYIHHGQERRKEKEFRKLIEKKDLIISSYATIRQDQEIFEGIAWDTIIVDEAQNIKNPLAKQTASINKLSGNHRFCLTGTPVENRLSELWSIMSFANPGFLSHWGSFKKRFAEPIEIENDVSTSRTLQKIISPFVMRRLKTDKNIISDLPKKTEIKEYCTLTKEQASLYQAVVDDSLEKIKTNGENRRALIMAALIKLKQVCNHPANYLKDAKKLENRSGKVARLREMLDVITKNNEKCLIFTQYKEMGDLLKLDLEEFFDIPVCFLHGEQNTKTRERMIEIFQSNDEKSPKIFILSLKAGGVGINLTKANHVIHFDRWWNPAVENQATDRAFRIGQRKDVFVYKFITSGTVEEKIDEMIESKLNLSNLVLSKGEMAITELDNKQLKELFELRKEYLEG